MPRTNRSRAWSNLTRIRYYALGDLSPIRGHRASVIDGDRSAIIRPARRGPQWLVVSILTRHLDNRWPIVDDKSECIALNSQCEAASERICRDNLLVDGNPHPIERQWVHPVVEQEHADSRFNQQAKNENALCIVDTVRARYREDRSVSVVTVRTLAVRRVVFLAQNHRLLNVRRTPGTDRPAHRLYLCPVPDGSSLE